MAYGVTDQKQCGKCESILPLSAFGIRSRGGPEAFCRPCFNNYLRAYRRRPSVKERERKRHALPHRQAENLERSRSPRAKRLAYERRVRKQFGVSAEDLARAFERQGGKCIGCLVELRFDRLTHIDHCHSTGLFRGLCCHYCNLLLGYARDRSETLKRLAAYLEEGR